uniref:Zf-TFIIB domain-containing protein n=1 Tax=Micromonospora robiginosa TaxID=2749844 RepID=A0A7L6B987_9ACTN
MQLICPKCRAEMRQYERSGVIIDQCGECRGIFLDRGELEKLFDAEANWNRQHGGGAPQAAYGHGQQQHYGYHGHYRRKKKHGFLGELFD